MRANFLQRVAACSAGRPSMARRAPTAPALMPVAPRFTPRVAEPMTETWTSGLTSAEMSNSNVAFHAERVWSLPGDAGVPGKLHPVSQATRDDERPDVPAAKALSTRSNSPEITQPSHHEETLRPVQPQAVIGTHLRGEDRRAQRSGPPESRGKGSGEPTAAQVVRAPRELRPGHDRTSRGIADPAFPVLDQARPVMISRPARLEAVRETVKTSTADNPKDAQAEVRPGTESARAEQRKSETIGEVSPRMLFSSKPSAATAAVPQAIRRPAAKRENRIHIGRVDVQLNNHVAAPVQPARVASAPVSEGLDALFLNRFPIRL